MALDEHHGDAAGRTGVRVDYRRLFDETPTPYLVLAPDLTIIEVNRAYLEATATRRDAILGRTVFKVFPDDPADPDADGTRNLVRSLRNALESGRPDTMAPQRHDIPVGPDGHFEERYWNLRNIPTLDEDGAVTHLILRVEDITDYVRVRREWQQAAGQRMHVDRIENDLFLRSREVQEANQQLREANNALAAAGEELREQQQAKDRFIATLSHELRNPIAVLRAAGELLALDAPDDHPAIPVLDRQVNVMVRMIEDLLDATRALAGRLELHSGKLDLRSVVSSAVDDMSTGCTRAQRHLRTSLPSAPVPVEGDYVRLNQMLGNLLSNGCKYTGTGGTVTVELGSQDGNAVLEVRDDGTGFDPEATESLFEVFGRAAQRPDAGGLGLGLHIVRSIAELHGGSVTAHSQGPGTGACFRVELPLAAPGAEPAEPASERPLPSARPAVRVLIIEDNTDLAATYQILLERRGDRVTLAHTGRDGVATARAHHFDLVLSDLALPDITGFELVRSLRSAPGTDRSLLVAVSCFTQDSDREEAVRAGFDAHLAKPLDTAALDELLNQWAPR